MVIRALRSPVIFPLQLELTILFSRVLITTDVWARGIDVQQVSLVINYDLPSYVLCSSEVIFRLTIVTIGIVKTIFTALDGLVGSVGRGWQSMYEAFVWNSFCC